MHDLGHPTAIDGAEIAYFRYLAGADVGALAPAIRLLRLSAS